MGQRNTRTGHVLEQMVRHALKQGGYECSQKPVCVGRRPSGGKHLVDVLATDAAQHQYLISLKWQQVGGTAEQKVPYEVICLAETILENDGKYLKAYLVLGGEGWTLRDFYIGGHLKRHLHHSHWVKIVSLETFVALANKGSL